MEVTVDGEMLHCSVQYIENIVCKRVVRASVCKIRYGYGEMSFFCGF